jgi:hypothetical protein
MSATLRKLELPLSSTSWEVWLVRNIQTIAIGQTDIISQSESQKVVRRKCWVLSLKDQWGRHENEWRENVITCRLIWKTITFTRCRRMDLSRMDTDGMSYLMMSADQWFRFNEQNAIIHSLYHKWSNFLLQVSGKFIVDGSATPRGDGRITQTHHMNRMWMYRKTNELEGVIADLQWRIEKLDIQLAEIHEFTNIPEFHEQWSLFLLLFLIKYVEILYWIIVPRKEVGGIRCRLSIIYCFGLIPLILLCQVRSLSQGVYFFTGKIPPRKAI